MDHNGERADTWVSDRFGRLIKIIDSAGNTQSMVYDRYSNLIQFTDREGNTVTSRYTDRGLLSSQVSNTGDEVTYRWDDLDRLAEVVDVAGGLYTFSYVGDTRRISAVTDPGGGVLIVGAVAVGTLSGPIAPFVAASAMSAGFSMISQKATTGSVDIGQLMIDTAIGNVSGAAGGAAGNVILNNGKQAIYQTFKTRLTSYAVEAAVSSAVETAGGYVVDTVRGTQRAAGDYATDFLTSFGTGLFASGIGGEWQHAADIREAQRLSIVGEPYAGIKEASGRMRELGIPREYRVQVLQSFEPETVRLNTAGTDVYGLRYHGGGSNEFGRYVTDTLPATRQSLALPAENTMEHLSQFRLSEGAEYISGRVAPNFGQPGGGTQYYLLDNPENVLEVLK